MNLKVRVAYAQSATWEYSDWDEFSGSKSCPPCFDLSSSILRTENSVAWLYRLRNRNPTMLFKCVGRYTRHLVRVQRNFVFPRDVVPNKHAQK